MLKKFVGDEEQYVFRANQTRQIRTFFNWVTVTVTSRLQSIDPDDCPITSIEDLQGETNF